MILCDTHADTLHRMAVEPGGQYDLSLDRLRAGGVSLQVMAMFVGKDPTPDKLAVLFDRMLEAKDQLLREGWLQTDDPEEAAAGQTQFMLSVEGCEIFEEDLHTIDRYRQLGVRMAAVTWNYENKLGTPACLNPDDGLKPYGLTAVRHMQRLGIAVDVSHLNIQGFYDILGKTDMPPMASHSCCRALRDHPRNLWDDQLKALFAAGGYIGVNFLPYFLITPDKPCTIDTVIDHIDHLHQLGGQGKVGFGSDFDGIREKPEDLDNPSDFPALLEGLRRRGYQEETIRDIAGRNLLAYYRRIAG